jgi:hypothetical protein
MSFKKSFALITLAVLILVGFASPAAINPDSTKANFARQDDVSSPSVDAYALETDAEHDLAHHPKLHNLTALKKRGKGDKITPNPAIGDVSIASHLHQSKKLRLLCQVLTKIRKTGGWCYPVPGQNWDAAYANTVQDGIDFLQSNGLICDVGPGPGNCVRVSCSYNSAIYLCNDVSNYFSDPIYEQDLKSAH